MTENNQPMVERQSTGLKIACIGGGPAGLYLGISLKLRNPNHQVDVYERNRPDDTFGWGVVFSDQTVDNLRANDPVSAETIVNEFIHWDLIDCFVNDCLFFSIFNCNLHRLIVCFKEILLMRVSDALRFTHLAFNTLDKALNPMPAMF